jgi:hypothetical protein
MTLREAVESGKPFRRPNGQAQAYRRTGQGDYDMKFVGEWLPVFGPSFDDAIADDWIVIDD